MQNTIILNRPLYPNLVIPAQPANAQAQAGTQSPPDPDPLFSKILNPANPVNSVNPIKILTVKNCEKLCQKFCISLAPCPISLAPQVVRPTYSENFPNSLFVRNIQK